MVCGMFGGRPLWFGGLRRIFPLALPTPAQPRTGQTRRVLGALPPPTAGFLLPGHNLGGTESLNAPGGAGEWRAAAFPALHHFHFNGFFLFFLPFAACHLHFSSLAENLEKGSFEIFIISPSTSAFCPPLPSQPWRRGQLLPPKHPTIPPAESGPEQGF